MNANIAILYVGQLERWTSNLQRKLLVLVVFVSKEIGNTLSLDRIANKLMHLCNAFGRLCFPS